MGGEWIETPYGRFAADFCVDRLANLCDPIAGIQTGPFGSQLHQKDYVEVGTPIITVEHLGENRILHENTPKVSNKDRNRLSRYLLKKGDIVFSRVGSVDRRALVREEEDGWLFSGRCLRVRPDPAKIDSQYLSYFFGLPAFKEYIRSIAVGATMPSLNTALLSDVVVPHSKDVKEQRAIAHILGTLDDKIELNRRRNQTLEAMARALFKDWFVDFGPVRAKMEGREPYLPADLWQLFPDRLDDEGKPEGWEMLAVGECFNLTMGQSPPGDTYNDIGDGLPFFQGRTDFGFRYPENRKFCSAPTRIADAEDTLVSVRAPVGDINLAWEKCCIGRGVAALRHLSGARSFTYHAIWSIQDELRQYEHTGTVFGAINKKQFESIGFINPRPELVESFEKKVSPVDSEVRNNIEESRTLAQLRDILLPKLISGELRIADAEKFLERMA